MISLGKSPLQKNFNEISTNVSHIRKNLATLVDVEKNKLNYQRDKVRNEKNKLKKEEQRNKKFGGELKKSIKKVSDERKEQNKTIIEQIIDLFVKGKLALIIALIVGIIVAIGAAIWANWEKIVEVWNWANNLYKQYIEPFINWAKDQINNNIITPGGEQNSGGSNYEQERESTNNNDIIKDVTQSAEALDLYINSNFGRMMYGEGIQYVQYDQNNPDVLKAVFGGNFEKIVKKSDTNPVLWAALKAKAMSNRSSMVGGLANPIDAAKEAMGSQEFKLQRFLELQKRLLDEETKNKEEPTDERKREIDKLRADLNKMREELKKQFGNLSKPQLSAIGAEALYEVYQVPEKERQYPDLELGKTKNLMPDWAQFLYRNEGGTVNGQIKSGDTVPALLEHGEYVLNRNAVALIGKDKLDEINFNKAPRFQLGGSPIINRSSIRLQTGGSVEKNMPLDDPSNRRNTSPQAINRVTPPAGNSGSIIAYTGGVPGAPGAGRTSGPHVHLELGTGRSDGKNYPTNLPGKYILVSGRPISSFPMVSDYGIRGGRLHRGKDYATPPNLPVTLTGGAIFKGFDKTSDPKGYGYMADIIDPEGRPWLMAHMSKEGNARPGFAGNSNPNTPVATSTGGGDTNVNVTNNQESSIGGIFGGFQQTAGFLGEIGNNLLRFGKGFISGFTSTITNPSTTTVNSVTKPSVNVNPNVSTNVTNNSPNVLTNNPVRNQVVKLNSNLNNNEIINKNVLANNSIKLDNTNNLTNTLNNSNLDLMNSNVLKPSSTLNNTLSSISGINNVITSNVGRVGNDTDKSTGDTVPALLEKGEYVLNKNAVNFIGKETLDTINFRSVPRFSDNSITSRLMSDVRTSMVTSNDQLPTVINMAGGSGQSIPSYSSASDDNIIPDLPSMPPGRIMQSIAYKPMGTTYSAYI